MNKNKLLHLFLCIALLYACGPARHLSEDQKLLTKVRIKSKANDKYEEELLTLVKQNPNRKFLGVFKIYLGVYNLYYNKKDSKVKEKIGEPPVVFDSLKHENSAGLMKRYLNNRGYYNNQIELDYKLKRKRAKVNYKVNKGKRYTIESLDYKIEDPEIRRLVTKDSTKSLIKVGEPFDLDKLKDQRRKIEELLKQNGYFKFSREFVIFEADTSDRKKTAKITLNVKDINERSPNGDSIRTLKHQKYNISDVVVRTNYVLQDRSIADSSRFDSILFLNYGSYYFKQNTLARLIQIRPGQQYDSRKQEATYSNLSSLGVFSLVSIQYEDNFAENGNSLTVYINLNPYKQKSFSIQTEGTNNGGNLGVNGNLSYQNKNTFHGAEQLNIKFRGGLEVQQLLTEDDNEDLDLAGGFFPFNTFEVGPEVSLEVPRFMIPFVNSRRFSVKGNPRTTFNASFNYQERPDYIRNISTAYIAYSWQETPTKTHIVQPFDLSFIKLNPSPEFAALLSEVNNPFLRNSYTDNLILALKYSFIFNNQKKNKQKDYIYFRANAESAGNAISAMTQGSSLEQNQDGSYNIAGIRFAQYIRSDVDFRFYQSLPFENKMVYRLATGVGIPYGNSKAMPFEKSFYAGGANNIRAWRARELGPGALPDSSESDVDQIGNMQIVANLELRFPVSELIEGAAFVDAGNVWNLDQEDSRESTEFQFSSLWRSTALGAGLGIRLNFTFFILRFDVATPLKDPSENQPSLIKSRWSSTNLNFGIGYPF